MLSKFFTKSARDEVVQSDEPLAVSPHNKDILVELSDFPQSSPGAPIPVVLSNEHTVFLCYLVQNAPKSPDHAAIETVDTDTTNQTVAVITFDLYTAYKFGPPNDEAIVGHPLHENGLKPYRVFEVKNSSWIEDLEIMNSVHPHHNKNLFDSVTHFIFTFHDSTFECVTDSVDIELKADSIRGVLGGLIEKI